jgi:hypothetical protein
MTARTGTTQTYHPISQAVAHDMLRGLVQSICDRPGQSKAQRDTRSTEVIHTVLAFQPRDPVELMFASMIVAHFHLVLHSAHEAFLESPEDLKPTTRAGIVALDRAMIGFVKELRVARIRPAAGADATASAAEPATRPESAMASKVEPATGGKPVAAAPAEASKIEPATGPRPAAAAQAEPMVAVVVEPSGTVPLGPATAGLAPGATAEPPAAPGPSREPPTANWRDMAPVSLLPSHPCETSGIAMLAASVSPGASSAIGGLGRHSGIGPSSVAATARPGTGREAP